MDSTCDRSQHSTHTHLLRELSTVDFCCKSAKFFSAAAKPLVSPIYSSNHIDHFYCSQGMNYFG